MRGYCLSIDGSDSPARTAKVLKLLWGEAPEKLVLPATDFFMAFAKPAIQETLAQVAVPAYLLGPSGAYHTYDYPFSAKYPAKHPVLFVDQHTDSAHSPGSIGCASFAAEIAKEKRVVYLTAEKPSEMRRTVFESPAEHFPLQEAGSFRPRKYHLDREKLLLLFDGDCLYGEALTGWPPHRKARGTSLSDALSLIKSVRNEAEIAGFSNWGFVSWDELTSGEKKVYFDGFSPERIGTFKRRTPIVSALIIGACLGRDLKGGQELLREADLSTQYGDFDSFFNQKYPV